MIGYKGEPQDVLNSKPNVTPRNCTSSHGITGFLEGTVFDSTLGAYTCPCGRQYFSNVPKPDWITDRSSFNVRRDVPVRQGYIGPATTTPMQNGTPVPGSVTSSDFPNGHPA